MSCDSLAFQIGFLVFIGLWQERIALSCLFMVNTLFAFILPISDDSYFLSGEYGHADYVQFSSDDEN